MTHATPTPSPSPSPSPSATPTSKATTEPTPHSTHRVVTNPFKGRWVGPPGALTLTEIDVLGEPPSLQARIHGACPQAVCDFGTTLLHGSGARYFATARNASSVGSLDISIPSSPPDTMLVHFHQHFTDHARPDYTVDTSFGRSAVTAGPEHVTEYASVTPTPEVSPPMVLSSEATIPEGSSLSFDTGAASARDGDVWWARQSESIHNLVPMGSALIYNLGAAGYEQLSPASLQDRPYATVPIQGVSEKIGQLVPGDVFAVRTRAGNYAKVQIVRWLRTSIQVRWVTYRLTK